MHQTAEGIHDALKRAQIYAQTGRHDSAYGVRIQTDEYILFEGESYSLRDVNEDQVFPVRGGVSFDGINEIVFEAHTGVPDTSGSIGVHTSSRSSIISVTEEGRIDH